MRAKFGDLVRQLPAGARAQRGVRLQPADLRLQRGGARPVGGVVGFKTPDGQGESFVARHAVGRRDQLGAQLSGKEEPEGERQQGDQGVQAQSRPGGEHRM